MIKKYKNDILILLIVLCIATVVAIIINICKTKGEYVKVSINNEIYEVYKLSENITVSLPTGNVLVINDGEAYISESNCPDKVCVNHAKISSEGESIICLPNKLVIEVTKENEYE